MIIKTILMTLLLSASFYVHAAQDAMVVKSRAIIYADKMLTAPIGYLRSGKKVKVGSNPRNNGRVLPILLKGRIGYIEITSLSFDTESKISKNRMKIFQKETKPKLYINYTYNLSGLGSQWDTLSQNVNDEASSLTTHRFDLEFHPPDSKAFGTIGLGYSKLTQNYLAISSYLFSVIGYYSIFKFRHFTFDLVGGIELSPQTSIQVRGIEGQTTGTTYGWQYGLQVRMMYNLRYGLVAGYYIKKAAAEKLTGIPDPNSSSTSYSITSISGSNIYIGLSYRFK